MAVAIQGRTEYDVQDVSTTVTIPASPTGRLMYYTNCVCTVVDMSERPNIQRLRDYKNWALLAEWEIDSLVLLCLLFSPKDLDGIVFFQDDSLCGEDSNKFLDLHASQNTMVLSDQMVIAGQRRVVKRIMAYKEFWKIYFWTLPMAFFQNRFGRIKAILEYSEAKRRRQEAHLHTPSSTCCTIL